MYFFIMNLRRDIVKQLYFWRVKIDNINNDLDLS